MNDAATSVSPEWRDEIEETQMKDLCKGMGRRLCRAADAREKITEWHLGTGGHEITNRRLCVADSRSLYL